MNWLILGGAGYIGSNLTHVLIESGFKVTIFDDFSTGQESKVHPFATVVRGSILDSEGLRDLFQSNNFEGVIHLAALKSITQSLTNPSKFFETNVLGTKNIAQAAAAAGVKRIIFSSTAAVYKMPTNSETLTEESPVIPTTPYGESKLMAESLLMEDISTNNLRSIVFRFFNVTGCVEDYLREYDGNNLFPVIERAIRDNLVVPVYGTDHLTHDGTCVRDYIHVSDICDAHLAAIKNFEKITELGNQVINLGTGHGISVLEVISKFEVKYGRKILWERKPKRVGDLPKVVCDYGKAKQILNWSPKLDPLG